MLKKVIKVFDKVIFARKYPPIEYHLNDQRYGVWKAGSIILQLVIYIGEIFKCFNNKESALKIDFRKAFDKVTHKKNHIQCWNG